MMLYKLITAIFLAIFRIDAQPSQFIGVSNQRMVAPGLLITTVKVNSNLECAMHCQRKSACKSINVARWFTKDNKLVCELLSSSVGTGTVDETFDYFQITDPCQQFCKSNDHCMSTLSMQCACQINSCPMGGLGNSSILSLHGNINYVKTLTKFLSPYTQSSIRWVKCWHAEADGWEVEKTFHPQCNDKGPTVTIVRVGRNVFGGFTDVSWRSTGGYHFSNRSFLYSLYNNGRFKPIRLSLIGDDNKHAVSSGIGFQGPTFGGGYDLFLSSQASSNNSSYTKPHTYKPPPGCTIYNYCAFFAGSNYFTPDDIEVFYEKLV